ncbi:urease accessory protein UreD [Actinomadura rupiterrae]|uniref:urease accessory protein UreD n=1 Tax=Actinomadura rupiterrae TaxID=559627 RepID=UPI0020A4064E|nr:urease accessory protein UreD [Actinomadura rupiterrae]MCP2339306.1 urease accessory protein [Actinomadura rupiterrae]
MTAAPPVHPPPDTAPTPHGAYGLHATARITAESAGGATDLPLLDGDGPFSLRRLRSRGTQARVCVLNTMSAPHNGDRLHTEVTVGPGADLHVITAAATIALPGPVPVHATHDLTLRVADHARLHWLPEPLISAAGSDLRQRIRIDLAPTARLVLSEQQILGRPHEPPGRLSTRITLRRDGRTLLDQHNTYGPGAQGWDGPAVLAGNRATGQLLIIDPAYEDHPPEPHHLDTPPAQGVITPLPGPGVLLTAIAPDAGHLQHCLNAALRHLGHHTQ